MSTSPATERLKGAEWYRNLKAYPDREMTLTWCDHICLLSLDTITACYGDITGGPCCTPMGHETMELPRTWRTSAATA